MLNNLLQIHLKLLQKGQLGKKNKTAEATSCLTGNKIADRISKISKNSPKNNSETNEEEEIVRERYISPDQRQKIIDDLILIYYNIIMENKRKNDSKNELSKFRTRNWVELNYESRALYIMKVIKLNLKLQLQGHIYAIIVMHTYMLMKL